MGGAGGRGSGAVGVFLSFDDYNGIIFVAYNLVIAIKTLHPRGSLSGDWHPSVHD